MKCKAKKADNAPCQAQAIRGTDYCYRHTKSLRTKALRASANGGKAKRQYNCYGKSMQIKTPADIKILMARAINSLWTGKMHSSNPAGSLGYLAKVFLDACNQGATESKEIKFEISDEQLKRIMAS